MKLSAMFLASMLAVGCTGQENVNAKAKEMDPGEQGSVRSVAQAAAKPSTSKAVPNGWIEDFEAAKKTAAKEKKNILLAFSGSDWCGWCVKLDGDVFSKKEFLDLASKRYVLVMIDNPQDENRLSAFAKEHNRPLLHQFAVRGFPCGVVCDSTGKELGRISGYVPGGPTAYFAAMEEYAQGK